MWNAGIVDRNVAIKIVQMKYNWKPKPSGKRDG